MAEPLRQAEPERFASEPLVGETAVRHLAEYRSESPAVVVLPLVEPEGFFVQVLPEMEGRNAHISSLDAPLERRPEAFEPVGVDIVPDVSLSAWSMTWWSYSVSPS